MAIKRLPQGERPSSVVGGAPKVAPSDFAIAADALGKVVDTGYTIAADAEAREAKRLRAIQEQMQAIDDTVVATRRSGDFEERDLGLIEGLKSKYANDPKSAIPEYMEVSRAAADQELESSPNLDVRQKMASSTASRTQQGTRELHDWVLSKTTQNIRANVDATLNEASARLEQFPGDVRGYEARHAAERARLAPAVVAALGEKGAADRLAKWDSESAYAYFNAKAILAPLDVKNQIESTSGIAARALTPDQRASLGHVTESRIKGLPLARQLDTLKKGLRQNADVGAHIMDGSMQPKQMFQILRAAEAEREVLALDKTVGADEKKARMAILDERLKFLNAGQDLMLNQAGFDLADKPAVAAEVNANQAKLIKAIGGKVKLKGDNGLTDVMKQYTAIFQAAVGGAIPAGAAKSMIRQLEQAMPAAYKKEQANTWSVLDWQLPYADADEAGNFTLEQEFKTRFPKATQEQINNATYRLRDAFVSASDAGKDLTPEQARKAAREAAARAMGQDPGNFFAGKAKR